MLKPKAEVGIAYGHDDDLRKAAVDAIEAMQAGGYRVRSRILTEVELRRENTTILDALLTTFRSLDAALVFMTADERSLSCKELALLPVKSLSGEELVQRLQLRPRQNVILELGLLIGTLGRRRVRLLGSREVEYPSDINGMYISDKLTPAGVEEDVHQIVVEILGLRKTKPPLTDGGRALSYADIAPAGSLSTLNVFALEYERLDCADDRLVYLLERVVFESYLQAEPDNKWWSSRVAEINPSDDTQRTCKRLLRLVTEYMAAWRPPDHVDYVAIENCACELEVVVEGLATLNIAPAAHIVANDYLGLAFDKVARQPHVSTIRQSEALSKAAQALQLCIDLASRHDDQDLRLWTGYALFNLARVDQRRGMEDWRATLRRAVSVRRSWQRAGHLIPQDLEDGLITEYFHAAAVLAELDDTLGEEQVALLYGQYDDWRSSARKRVRLARNVADTWARIRVRRPT